MTAVRQRHPSGAAVRPTHVSSGVNFGAPSFPLYGSQMDIEALSTLDLGRGSVTEGAIRPGGLDGSITIAAGTLPAVTFDITPPAVPTGLTLTSDIVRTVQGASLVRLIATLVHPVDSDYFGSWIEITRDNNGDDITPLPVWTQPIKLLLGKESTSVAFEGALGNSIYWARAFSVDVQGNKSAYTGYVSATTIRDTTPPLIPQGIAAVGGFRGAAVSWNQTTDNDLANYQLQWSIDGVNFTNPVSVFATVVWIPGLDPGTLYTFQVQAQDLSGNLSGYSTTATATPSQVGAADIAANSVTAAMIATSGLTADQILAGTLTLAPGLADAIKIVSGSSALLGSWDPTNGIQIFDPTDSSNYAIFSNAVLSFYQGGLLTAQISPAGVLADSVRLGTLSGGHNLIQNSSFELAAFVTALTVVTFTDTTASPGWKAANRITALDNITESTTLTAVF